MKKESKTMAYLALSVICIVWGTTYYSLRIGVETFPPFLFAAIRMFSASLLLMVGLKLAGKLIITKQVLIAQFILGFLMIALGNGVIGWSERYIPSGLAALIVSILPVYIILINYLVGIEKRKPNGKILLGIIGGFCGILLIFKDNLKDFVNPDYFWGTVLAFLACLAWAFGSVYSKKVSTGNLLTNASFQMFFGSIILFAMSGFLDDFSELKSISTASIGALVYLILVGSVLAYPCYIYALDKLPIGLVSLYSYINPFIALLLGYFLLQEELTPITWSALIAVLMGIYCINKGYQQMKEKQV